MQSKRCFVILSALVFALGLSAAQAKHCLWKVSSKTGTLYLQGSVHILKEDQYPLDPAIEAAYSQSESLVLEVDLSEMNSIAAQQLLMSKAMLVPPASLKTVLKPETYQALVTASDEVDLPIAAIQQSEPWFAAMTLTMLAMQKNGFDPQSGVDKYFYNKATDDSKPVVGLETLDFQINLLSRLASMNPDDFVSRSLLDLKLLNEEMEKLMAAWKTGDIVMLDQLMSESFKDYPDLYNQFIVERNQNWAKVLSEMLDEKKVYMVVVGAGHFGGEQGLLKLLEQKGYTLEQL